MTTRVQFIQYKIFESKIYLCLKFRSLKYIISILLKNIPRKYLQLFSHIVLKAVSIFYVGKNVQCPVCEKSFRKFLPYGRKARENALCPN
jgi:hypothetical protein